MSDVLINHDTDNKSIINIHIKGDLSFKTVSGVFDKTKACFGDGQHVQVDLDEVQRTDSAAMALILEWHRLAKKNNSEVKLRNIPSMLKNIASVSDLEELIQDKN